MMLMMQMGTGGGDIVSLHGVTYFATLSGGSCSVSYTISGSPTSVEVLTDEFGGFTGLGSVSYTHLTLPTKRIV